MYHFCLGLLLTFVEVGGGANILVIPGGPGPSHMRSMAPLASILGQQGHNVTMWYIGFQPAPLKNPDIKEFNTQITTSERAILDALVYHNDTGISRAVWNTVTTANVLFGMAWSILTKLCALALEQKLADFHQLAGQDWDLLLVDPLFAPCGVAMAEATPAPVLLYSSSNLFPHTDRAQGKPLPVGVAPHGNVVEYNYAGFTDRLSEVITWSINHGIATSLLSRYMDWMLRPYLNIPITLSNYEQRASFIIDTIASTLAFPTPEIQSMVHIGNVQCRTLGQAPLTEPEFLDFVNDPKSKGTIVAAFGHMVNWNEALQNVIPALYEGFKRLGDYRIIWQYNGPPLPTVKHIKTVKWLPQIALLEHPKTRVFLSHAGLKSALETLCAQLPVAAMPVYAEQFLNTRILVKRHKCGVYLNKFTLTADDVENKLLEVTNNYDAYKANVVKAGKFMADVIMPDMEKGAFWIGFNLRHPDHMDILQSRAKHLGWVKYFNIDIIIPVIFVGIFVLYLALKLAALLVSACISAVREKH